MSTQHHGNPLLEAVGYGDLMLVSQVACCEVVLSSRVLETSVAGACIEGGSSI
jgi:hypothetical protein